MNVAEAFAVDARALPFAPVAVLFDMDGLMIDSERTLLQCWREAAGALSMPVDDALLLAMVGLDDVSCRALLRDALGAAADSLRAEADARYESRIAAGLPLKPGVFLLLRALQDRGVPRAVVTATRRARALEKLQRCALLPHFDAVVAGDDVPAPKPAPDGYLLAARTLGVDATRCVVLEDSAPGVRAALAAGTTPIQIPDLVPPDIALRALGHRVVPHLGIAQGLIEAALEAGDW